MALLVMSFFLTLSCVKKSPEPSFQDSCVVSVSSAKNSVAGTTKSVTFPFYGNCTSSSDAVKWYNTTGSSAHKAYATFDDSNAYDINLAGDRDQELPVLSPFAGTVTKLGTTFPCTTDGGSLGAVLINIGNGNYVGYMHLKSITVKNGDAVIAGQQIGKIGNVGATNNHLHFAYYTREGIVLKSKTVSFTERAFTMPLS